jgi:hypothetical protein
MPCEKTNAKSPGKLITYGHICQHVVIRSTVVRQLVDWCTKQIIDDQNCIVQWEVLRLSSCRKRRRCKHNAKPSALTPWISRVDSM